MADGAGGYNIPISVSLASTFSVPQTANAPTYIIFGSGNKTGGDTQQNPSNINPATAVSSASQGDGSSARSAAKDTGVASAQDNTNAAKDNTMLYIIAALVIGAAIYFKTQ
jgi:hypothetical protein